MVTFKTKEEMLEKIRFYLKNSKKRGAIALAGYKKTIKNYDQYKHFNKLFDIIFSNKDEPLKPISFDENYKVAVIKKEELEDIKLLKEKLENYDYVSFFDKGAKISPYRNFFHVYSINQTKKPMSICDPYLYSKSLGDFLSIYTSYAFQVLDKKDFYKILNPSQIVVEKDYFIKNMEKFKLFLDEQEIDFISEENTSFILIPLVSIKNVENLGHEKMNKISLPRYEVKMHNLANKKSLFYNKFIYSLALKSIINYPFILRSLINKSLVKKQYSIFSQF